MSRLPKLYPDLPLPLLGFLLADALAALWAVAWGVIGDTVYNAVMTLSVIARGVIATGEKLNVVIAQIQQALSGLPLVGPDLSRALAPLYAIPRSLIAQGQSELLAIQHLALLLGVVVAGVPLLAMLFLYIPWRVRTTRGFRALNRMLRRPGARVAAPTMEVLAARALYTLPYDQLLRYSPDPLAEWRDGRHYNLARATMAQEGLDLRRYLRRVERGTPPNDSRDVRISEGMEGT